MATYVKTISYRTEVPRANDVETFHEKVDGMINAWLDYVQRDEEMRIRQVIFEDLKIATSVCPASDGMEEGLVITCLITYEAPFPTRV